MDASQLESKIHTEEQNQAIKLIGLGLGIVESPFEDNGDDEKERDQRTEGGGMGDGQKSTKIDYASDSDDEWNENEHMPSQKHSLGTPYMRKNRDQSEMKRSNTEGGCDEGIERFNMDEIEGGLSETERMHDEKIRKKRKSKKKRKYKKRRSSNEEGEWDREREGVQDNENLNEVPCAVSLRAGEIEKDVVDSTAMRAPELESGEVIININNGSNSNDGDDEEENLLETPKDSYAMFFVAVTPLERYFAFFVFCLQAFVLTFVFIDLLQFSDRQVYTTMNTPVGASSFVTLSQYVTCFISVFTSDDLISGIIFIQARPKLERYAQLRGPAISQHRSQRQWYQNRWFNIFVALFVLAGYITSVLFTVSRDHIATGIILSFFGVLIFERLPLSCVSVFSFLSITALLVFISMVTDGMNIVFSYLSILSSAIGLSNAMMLNEKEDSQAPQASGERHCSWCKNKSKAMVLLFKLSVIVSIVIHSLLVYIEVNFAKIFAAIVAGCLSLVVAIVGVLIRSSIELKEGRKWKISNIMRMTIAIYAIIISFIFIVQSQTVIDIFLNFAAVAFVSELDNVAFTLCERGLFGLSLQKLAKRVSGIKVSDSYSSVSDGSPVSCTRIIRTDRLQKRLIAVVLVTVSMWVGLTYVLVQQAQRVNVCQSITISFAESDHPWLRMISGTYDINHENSGQRSVYVKQRSLIALAYCSWDNRWHIFSYDPEDQNKLLFSCGGKVYSERTRTYDVTEIASFQYLLDDSVTGNIKCNDCINVDQEISPCGGWGRGHCENRKCMCNQGIFGSSCQFGPCTQVHMEGNEFHPFQTTFSKSFDLMYYEDHSIALVYDRPVFYQEFKRSHANLIIFDGGRWRVLSLNLPVWENYTTIEQRVDFLTTILLYGGRSDYEVLYMSDATQQGTPDGVPFREWMTEAGNAASSGTFGEEEFRLYCMDCAQNINLYSNGGWWVDDDGASKCVDTNGKASEDMCISEFSPIHGNVTRCKCEPGFEGVLCHERPAEGTLTIYLDNGGMCSVCNEGNTRTLWNLDGLNKTCLPVPPDPLVFEVNGTLIYRQLFIILNLTHFAVYLSDNNLFSLDDEEGDSSLDFAHPCTGNVIQEFMSIRRNSTTEHFHLDFVIELRKDTNLTGEIKDRPDIDCPVETRVNSGVCHGSKLSSVYTKTDKSTSLENAWVDFDFRVTSVDVLSSDGNVE